MDGAKLRSYWFEKQGLDGSLQGAKPEQVLERAGWARSVGGSNPYITLFARAGTSREAAERAVEKLQIHELPSARGCTYFVPKNDFALALVCGQGFSEEAAMNTARKYLGVTDKEIDRLSDAVLKSLASGPKDPQAIKKDVGDLSRNLGEEGKKKGQTTTLPLAFGRLQAAGLIRRVPMNGRLDTQRFSYALWNPSPLEKTKVSKEQAHQALAKKYFTWTGPASVANFRWFSALGAREAKAALEPLNLVSIDEASGLLILPSEKAKFDSHKPKTKPQYALVAGIDSSLLLRREVRTLIEPGDENREVFGEKGLTAAGGLQDLPSHAILDRGRLIGLWEFDASNGTIAWLSWTEPDKALRECVARMEAFVRDELGDARSFSLDSPESRAPRIAAIRK